MKIFLANLGAQDPSLSKDAIAELLKVSPKIQAGYSCKTLHYEEEIMC